MHELERELFAGRNLGPDDIAMMRVPSDGRYVEPFPCVYKFCPKDGTEQYPAPASILESEAKHE